MTPEKMTLICNIQMMREKITGIKTDYNNVEKSDLYSKNVNELYELQNSLIVDYNEAVKL